MDATKTPEFPPRRAEAIEPSAPELKYAVPVVFGTWPNITGDSDNGGESSLSYSPNGVFYSRIVAEGEAMSYRPENNTNIEVICLDASRVSNIYNGSKMQPKALQVLACIKI